MSEKIKAKVTFHQWDDKQARTVTFNVGDEVPDHIAAKVGAHAVTHKPSAVSSDDGGGSGSGDGAFTGEAFDQAVADKANEEVEAKVAEAVDAHRERESAAFQSILDQETEFDPAADGVKAADVKGYLEGLDRETAAGAYEYDRVVKAEESGANRSTALPD